LAQSLRSVAIRIRANKVNLEKCFAQYAPANFPLPQSFAQDAACPLSRNPDWQWVRSALTAASNTTRPTNTVTSAVIQFPCQHCQSKPKPPTMTELMARPTSAVESAEHHTPKRTDIRPNWQNRVFLVETPEITSSRAINRMSGLVKENRTGKILFQPFANRSSKSPKRSTFRLTHCDLIPCECVTPHGLEARILLNTTLCGPEG
jgi:hypothetical protein